MFSMSLRLVGVCIALTSGFLVAYPSIAEPTADASVPGSPWPATDALGRETPTSNDVGQLVPDRFVGIFYFLWHNEPSVPGQGGQGPPDVTRILAADPNALSNPNSPFWGPLGSMHYWGEPLFGYYRSTDPWVLRRHAHLLADAGIDTLIFDTTNAATYPEVYLKLCEVFTEIRKAGGRTPQVAFMVNTAAEATAMQLWQDFYSKNLYSDLWFRWQGKPLLLCDPSQANDTLRNFFTLRRAHWPFEMVNTDRAWHWEATSPQPFGFDGDPKRPEQVSVSVAQNLRASDGLVTDMSAGDARGRSFHNGRSEADPEAVNLGLNFQEQWQRAFDFKPPFVLVTGWNEWIASRFQRPNAPVVFVDQLNQEFSRDIEPMKQGHGDNYYYQLVANVRRYKGSPEQGTSPGNRTIDIAGEMVLWQQVETTFPDHVGETIPRDYDGVGGTHYTNNSGRNDIVESKVCRDAKRTYFWVRTREPLTAASGPNWMWLLIDRDQNSSTGWNGYDLIVNRVLGRVELNEGGWKWKDAGEVDYRVEKDQLQLALPNELFGDGAASKTPEAFDFQWADNLQRVDDVMDFYLSGDAAPEGRFRYRCKFK